LPIKRHSPVHDETGPILLDTQSMMDCPRDGWVCRFFIHNSSSFNQTSKNKTSTGDTRKFISSNIHDTKSNISIKSSPTNSNNSSLQETINSSSSFNDISNDKSKRGDAEKVNSSNIHDTESKISIKSSASNSNTSLIKKMVNLSSLNKNSTKKYKIGEPSGLDADRNITFITKSKLKKLKNRVFESLHWWLQVRYLQTYVEGPPREPGSINFVEEDGSAVAYNGRVYKPPDISKWENNSLYWNRSGRFPSLEERIKLYMGYWYDVKPNTIQICQERRNLMNLPCNFLDEGDKKSRLLCFSVDDSEHDFYPNKLYSFSEKKINTTSRYLRDLVDLSILHADSITPILVHIGDGPSKIFNKLNYSYPIFNKVQDLVSEKSRENDWNIIWPLNRKRHFASLGNVPQNDRPWHEKIPKLIWRGRTPNSLLFLKNEKPIELDSWKQRLSLVRNFWNSSLVDAKFVGKHLLQSKYYAHKLNMSQMLQYKYQIAVEGNDVATGLKWMLFSKSLLFMPPIKFSSWVMESLLEPFVHYIPIHANMSNVEEMVEWANSHPVKSKQIAERGTLFVYDLFFHPNAYLDEELILTEIYKRYERTIGCS